MPPRTTALLLGCGATLRRVARRLVAEGMPVIATTRRPDQLVPLAGAGAAVLALRIEPAGPGAVEVEGHAALAQVAEGRRLVVVHSIPPIHDPDHDTWLDATSAVLTPLASQLARVVYLSSTGVYGAQQQVDAATPVAPVTPRQQARVAAEQAVHDLGAPALILRPAAIYGPGRGVLARLRAGTLPPLPADASPGSRIHIDDLATHVHAGVHADLTGAFPVADDEPATTADVAALAARLIGRPVPVPSDEARVAHVPRQVDGREVREALGIRLRYPTYRVGMRRV